MNMRLLLAILITASFHLHAEEIQLTFSEANKIWEKSKDREDYQVYSTEFAQFSNHFRLDEKDGCYSLSEGSVELMLVITHIDGAEYAKIENVLSNVDNPKSDCFKGTYHGIPTKVPPFFPFVLQMSME